MFYAQFVLSKKGPLAKIWLSAHLDKKLTKQQILETDVENACDEIIKPKVKIALRTSGHLLVGVTRIHWRKAKYLLEDCNMAHMRLRHAFDSMDVDAVHAHAADAAITMTTGVYDDMDASLEMPLDIGDELPMADAYLSFNQSAFDEITLLDVPARISAHTMDDMERMIADDFGDTAAAEDTVRVLLPPLRAVQADEHARLSMGGDAMVDEMEAMFDASRLRATASSPPLRAHADDMDMTEERPRFEHPADRLSINQFDELQTSNPLAAHFDDKADMSTLQHTNSFQLDALSEREMPIRRKPRKRRQNNRPIIDVNTYIGSVELRQQQTDYDDTMRQWTLAPPTQRLMHLKAVTLDKEYGLPASDTQYADAATRALHDDMAEWTLRVDADDEGHEPMIFEEAMTLGEQVVDEWTMENVMESTRIDGEQQTSNVDLGDMDAARRDSTVLPPIDEDVVPEASTPLRPVNTPNTERRPFVKAASMSATDVATRIAQADKQSITFAELSAGATRAAAAKQFYAVLCMASDGVIDVTQVDYMTFGHINICMAGGAHHHDDDDKEN